MKLIVGLAMVWTSVKLSRSQCVLEKEYFCSSIPNSFPEGLTSILFVVTNLGVINSTVFNSPSLESITSLALANSGITKIEAGAFHAFRRLTKLSLYRNSLMNVMASWLFDPGRLENLTAAHNLISEISPNMFSSFTNLTTLNLANNQIRRIASGSFKALSKLTLIDLSGNNLTILTRGVFSGLRNPVMKLGSNPWHCSCELQDFGLFLQDLANASLLEDAASVVCQSPPSLEGTHVWNISHLNCSPEILFSLYETGFHKAGLPALLTCLVLIFFILLLFLIWMVKQEEPVRPRKEASGPSTGMKASNLADSSAATFWHSDEKNRPAESEEPQAGVLKTRAKSASAILLQREFQQGQRQVSSSSDVSQKHLTTPHVVLTKGREELPNLMESWYYKLQESNKSLQNHNANSFLAKVCIETPVLKAASVAAKQILQEVIPEDNKGQDSVENSEPFTYLSVTTATEEQTDAQCKKEAITNTGRSHLESLRRALTWPYERNTIKEESNLLSVRDSFIAQFFLPVVNLGKSPYAGNRELEEDPEHLRKESQTHYGSPEINRGAELAKDKEPSHTREVMVAAAATEPVGIEKSELDEETQRQCDLCVAVQQDYQVHESRNEFNPEAKPTNQAQLQKHSRVAVRGVHNSRSAAKAAGSSPREKNKRFPKPVSSRSRIHHEIHPSPLLSDDTSQTSSLHDEVLLENYNYISLLHEIVENRGRWTRERWKQTHQMHVVHPAKSQ